jgi:TolB-like protein/Tfp pilus assembly protein PilF
VRKKGGILAERAKVPLQLTREAAMTSASSHMRQEQVRLPSHIIDLAADELRSTTGEQVDLRPRSLAVLRLLAENAGRLVSKDEIIASVWGDVVVTDDSLTQCVADIRKAIGDGDRRILRTLPRRGYLLVPSQRKADLPTDTSNRPVIAVIPFTSPVNAKGQALAIGVASEILNELARHRDLKVIGRDSSFALGGQAASAQELGQRLGARYLVEGTAQRSKNMLVVDVQLVDTRNGVIAWGDRFSAIAADIPRVQQFIVGRIAASLRISMREAEKQEVLGRAPADLGVYELTLRGAGKHRFNAEATRAAREDLEAAIRLDPNYAPAWGLRAWINMVDIWNHLTGEWDLSRIDAVAGQFRHAIELAPNSAKAYQGLSQAVLTMGDLEQALKLSCRAMELAPSDPDCLLFHAVTLFESGDLSGAAEAIEKALELHPMRPSYYSFYYAMILWGSERYHEALDETDDCLRKAPQLCATEVYRTLALVGLGRVAEAKAQLAQYVSRSRPPLRSPYPPELASRFLAQLQAAGWRPALATDRKAV